MAKVDSLTKSSSETLPTRKPAQNVDLSAFYSAASLSDKLATYLGAPDPQAWDRADIEFRADNDPCQYQDHESNTGDFPYGFTFRRLDLTAFRVDCDETIGLMLCAYCRMMLLIKHTRLARRG
jgi:hypothetical protein